MSGAKMIYGQVDLAEIGSLTSKNRSIKYLSCYV